MNDLTQAIIDKAAHVIALAAKQGLTLATAESCTGGGIGRALTAVPGSSRVFLGGVIAYANSAKQNVLGVPAAIIDSHGAVSAPVAKEMAERARILMNADIAVSATGIAGPGGGTDEKPVGLVYIGIAQAGLPVMTKDLYLGPGRETVRDQTIETLLDLLILRLG